jgi:4-hydroxythreonine-4-phosphate dehydrogenase
MVRLAVSCGDPSGIGARLAANVLNEAGSRDWHVSLCGPPSLWRGLGITPSSTRKLVGKEAGAVVPGQPCELGAKIQVRALLDALDRVDCGDADALVTLPVHKEQLHRGGLSFAGHTEFFRSRYPSENLVMAFVSEGYWLALATDHIALAEVPRALSVDRLVATGMALHRASALPLAFCGLNPHAGEGGMLGDEELGWGRVFDEFQTQGVPCRGFLPADGLFARWDGSEAIVALYHDQGLAPFKALTANRACQISLGLPFVRTSPDHGTAYDLAKSDKGDAGSTRIAFEAAIKLASS